MKKTVVALSLLLSTNFLFAKESYPKKIVQIATCTEVKCVGEVINFLKPQGIYADSFKFKGKNVVYTFQLSKINHIKKHYPDAFNSFLVDYKKDFQNIEELTIAINKMNLKVASNMEDYRFQKQCISDLEREKLFLEKELAQLEKRIVMIKSKLKTNSKNITNSVSNAENIDLEYQANRKQLSNLEKEYSKVVPFLKTK